MKLKVVNRTKLCVYATEKYLETKNLNMQKYKQLLTAVPMCIYIYHRQCNLNNTNNLLLIYKIQMNWDCELCSFNDVNES